MRGVFEDEKELKRQSSGGDAEFTLGAGTLLLLFTGLVVVCGICFGLGYMTGHRGSASQVAALPPAGTPAVLPSNSSQAKPLATAQIPAPSPATTVPPPANAVQAASTGLPQSSAAVVIPVAPSQGAVPVAAQPQVRPALPLSATAAQTAVYPSHPADSASQPTVLPAAISQTASLWVQIAAVSHVEDARVLANALRNRGYAVSAVRGPDNLIHVRIGPFSTRDEANGWRSKLLNDGYNAQIQQ
jgi:DedD protein